MWLVGLLTPRGGTSGSKIYLFEHYMQFTLKNEFTAVILAQYKYGRLYRLQNCQAKLLAQK